MNLNPKVLGLFAVLTSTLLAQPEMTPWGNLRGVRVEKELLPFTTSLRAVAADGKSLTRSSKYNWEGRQTYERTGDANRSMSHALNSLPIDYQVSTVETGPGAGDLKLTVQAKGDVNLTGLYFCVSFRQDVTPASSFAWLGAQTAPTLASSWSPTVQANGLKFTQQGVTVEITASSTLPALLREDFVHNPDHLNDPSPQLWFTEKDPVGLPAEKQFYFQLKGGALKAGESFTQTFAVRTSGRPALAPVTLQLQPEQPGRAFIGIGGNYRTQFPKEDPMVIEYCLQHLNVRYGRISMWWEQWHPNEQENPLVAARTRGVTEGIQRQLAVAKELTRRGIPLIVSVWSTPDWAVNPHFRPSKGVQLDPTKLNAVAESIADYLVYLKTEHGIEPTLFSFNEPDYGVEVRQTAEEHRQHSLIIGRRLEERGLVTKMLLADTGAGTLDRVEWSRPAITDPALRPYAGAIAYHNYHGITDRDVAGWADLARQLPVPLMGTEGGPDSAAHRYRLVFLDPWFALEEADQYIRMCATGMMATIMPWQLTADYSPLTGQGLYGDNGPLRPTQRFWTLQQLGGMPAGALSIPVQGAQQPLSAAAFLSRPHDQAFVHVVNSGGARLVHIAGWPAYVKSVKAVTSDEKSQQALAVKSFSNGVAVVEVPAMSMVTLTGGL